VVVEIDVLCVAAATVPAEDQPPPAIGTNANRNRPYRGCSAPIVDNIDVLSQADKISPLVTSCYEPPP